MHNIWGVPEHKSHMGWSVSEVKPDRNFIPDYLSQPACPTFGSGGTMRICCGLRQQSSPGGIGTAVQTVKSAVCSTHSHITSSTGIACRNSESAGAEVCSLGTMKGFTCQWYISGQPSCALSFCDGDVACNSITPWLIGIMPATE